MEKPVSKLKVSDPKVLVGLAIVLMLLGGAVMDPLAGLVCFVLSGILTLIAGLKGTGGVRYLAVLLLIIIAVLTVLKFPEASRHQELYRSRSVTGTK